MRTVILNAALVNYDGKIDFQQIAPDVVIYEETPEALILERVQGASIVVTKEMKLSGEIIRQLPSSVKMICEAGTGYNNIDLAAVREKGIVLCNIPSYSTQRVAHTAILLLLSLASSMGQQIRMLAHGDHSNFRQHLMVNHEEINNKTLGIIGYGNIGQEVGKVAQALGMTVLATTRTPREDPDGVQFTDVDDLLRRSDFVSLHCPLTDGTRHLINARSLALMKPTAYLINTARGALVDEAALITALQDGTLAGAGLDVQEVEPPDDSSPLFNLGNVILTPHMGWRGLETRQRLVSLIKDNITAFVDGNPINRVA